METPDLKALIGKKIIASLPFLNPDKFEVVTLHGIEGGGLWIETQAVNEYWLQKRGQLGDIRTPVFFVPFAQIQYVAAMIEQTALSEKAFGGKG